VGLAHMDWTKWNSWTAFKVKIIFTIAEDINFVDSQNLLFIFDNRLSSQLVLHMHFEDTIP